MASKKCITEGCDNIISDGSRLDECPTCRSSWYRWRKRRPAEVLLRRSKLRLYSGRIDHTIEVRKIKQEK